MKLKKAAFVSAFLFSSGVLAAVNAYDMRINMAYNGKVVLSPKLVAEEGEKIGISENIDTDEVTMEVVASKAAKNRVKLDFIISKKSLLSGEEAGNLTVTRSLNVAENKNTEVEIPFSKTKKMKLKILAKAVNAQQDNHKE